MNAPATKIACDYIDPFSDEFRLIDPSVKVSTRSPTPTIRYSDLNSKQEHLLGYRRGKWDMMVAKHIELICERAKRGETGPSKGSRRHGSIVASAEYVIYLLNTTPTIKDDRLLMDYLCLDPLTSERDANRCFKIEGHGLPYYVDNDDTWDDILSVLVPMIEVNVSQSTDSFDETTNTYGLTSDAIVDYLTRYPDRCLENRGALLLKYQVDDGGSKEVNTMRMEISALKRVTDELRNDIDELTKLFHQTIALFETNVEAKSQSVSNDARSKLISVSDDLSPLTVALIICIKIGVTSVNTKHKSIAIHNDRVFGEIKNLLFDDRTISYYERYGLSPSTYVQAINDKIKHCGAAISASGRVLPQYIDPCVEHTYLESSDNLYHFYFPVDRKHREAFEQCLRIYGCPSETSSVGDIAPTTSNE